MTRSLAIAAIVATALAARAVHAEAPRWEPAWQDEFDGPVDTDVWTVVHSTEPTNKSLHAYLPAQVATADGRLVLTATDEPYEKLAYRSGQVISKSEQLYGRWEVRAKLPTSRGQWPAIWLLPVVSKHNWPSGGEIDIVENRGDQPRLTSSAFHYGTNPPYLHNFVMAEQRTSRRGELVDYHNSFHTYTVDWTKRYLRFYVDGVHYYTVHDSDVDGFLSSSVQPMQLVINNAIGGTFLDDPDETSEWPQEMQIDWVRVYKLAEGAGDVEFANGGFEADGGSLAGWSVFGSNTAAMQNASASSEVIRDGAAALKLFGTFGTGGRYSGIQQGVTVEPGQPVVAELAALIQSADSIAGTGNRAILKLEFYREFGGAYGSDALLAEEGVTIADRDTPNDRWQESTLRAVAPAGAAEARLSLVFDQPNEEGGAVYIDAIDLRVGEAVASATSRDGRFGIAGDPTIRNTARPDRQ